MSNESCEWYEYITNDIFDLLWGCGVMAHSKSRDMCIVTIYKWAKLQLCLISQKTACYLTPLLVKHFPNLRVSSKAMSEIPLLNIYFNE